MIYHIRSKYTAVGKLLKKKKNFFFVGRLTDKHGGCYIGRQEIVMYFYMYMLTTLLDMLLVTGIIPTSSSAYPVSNIY